MPEGHVIHRLAYGLTSRFAGEQVAVSSPQGRFATQAAALDGAVLAGAEAWGKHLFIHFGAGGADDADRADGADPRTIHIHLGLIGTLRFEPVAPPHGQVRLRIADSEVAADLRGPQRCVLIGPPQEDAAVAKLGADPLRTVGGGTAEGTLNEAKLATTFAKTGRSSKAVGALLMDQGLYAGVGSIYRTEVLFRLGIDPHVPGKALDAAQLRAIWDDTVGLMRYGEERGRIDTVRPEHTPEAMGRPPRKDDHGGEVYAYRRAGLPCLVCGTPVEVAELAGRKVYWCPTCQRG